MKRSKMMVAALMQLSCLSATRSVDRVAQLVPAWAGIMPITLDQSLPRRSAWILSSSARGGGARAAALGARGAEMWGIHRAAICTDRLRRGFRSSPLLTLEAKGKEVSEHSPASGSAEEEAGGGGGGGGGGAAAAAAQLNTVRKLEIGKQDCAGIETGPFQNRGPDCMAALASAMQEVGILDSNGEIDKLCRMLFADALVYALAMNLGIPSSHDKDPWVSPPILLALAHMYKVKISCTDLRLSRHVYLPPDGVSPSAEIRIALQTDGFYSWAEVGPGQSTQGELWIFFDLETTGLDTDRDRIVQIAASAYHTRASAAPGSRTSKATLRGHFNCFVAPGIPVSQGAADVTGLTTERLAPYPGFEKQGPLFVSWLERTMAETGCRSPIMAAHNGNRFDFPLLRSELRRHGVDAPPLANCRYLDTLLYFRETGSQKNRLGDLYMRRFGKPMQDAHDARADVAALARVTLAGEKRGGEQSLSEEEETVVPWELEACHTRINRLTAWCAQNGMKAI